MFICKICFAECGQFTHITHNLSKITLYISQAWSSLPVIPAVGRQRSEDLHDQPAIHENLHQKRKITKVTLYNKT